MGIISRSSSRYMSECWFCIEMNGVRRFCRAYSVSCQHVSTLGICRIWLCRRSVPYGGAKRREERTLHDLELPRPATAHTDIPDPARLHHIVQSLHGLFDGRVIVEAVALEDIDIVELQAL